MILTITGASGVGKTSIAKAISASLPENAKLKVFHFDDIDFPDWDKMSPDEMKDWQRNATLDWIAKVVAVARDENVDILFEGSTDFNFFVEGFQQLDFKDYRIILFDCSIETMQKRLIERGQPELFHDNMVGWLNYLRREAKAHEVEIINTETGSINEMASLVLKYYER